MALWSRNNERQGLAPTIWQRMVCSWTRCGVVLVASALAIPMTASTSFADDKADAASETNKTEKAAGEEKEKEEVKPIEVPDGTAEELFVFIDKVKGERGRTLETVMRSMQGVFDTTEKIRGIEDLSLEDELKAINEALVAQAMLARFSPLARDRLATYIEELAKDPRAEIQRLAAAEQLKQEIQSVRTASDEKKRELVDKVLAIIDEGGIDQTNYRMASQLAYAIGYGDNTELAASFYESLASRLEKAEDAKLRDAAPRAAGAARRLRLPGNFFELSGTTADGETFDWSAYRGKVVLVDYWASWCGPCRGEVPNMKKNLEKFGDAGFAIVGINMDSTSEAYESYVEKEEIPWVNLVNFEPDSKGWQHPMAVHYGVSGIPTAILVNGEGKVISLSARGKTLDKLLAETLGEPDDDAEVKDEEGEAKDDAAE
ncbi:TlpA family protein disulfide reductase [Novipirellula sp.]|uniref:TlpA family protein disulfide reductase n=1 Tax=Novipirellula sp. TaxID=2795430 RepID=UPI0035673EF5